MKTYAAASLFILGLTGLALAQSVPPTMPAGAMTIGHWPAPPPPLPNPVGSADPLANGDYVIGPDYVPAAELALVPSKATGALYEITMLAKDSKIYPGRKRKVGYTPSGPAPGGRGNAVPGDVQWEASPYQPRHVWLYVPSGTKKGAKLPLMVVMDGFHFPDLLHRIMDNLIAEKRVPAMAVVMVDSGSTPVGGDVTEDGQGSERGYEYDTVSGQFSDFIETEVLPRVSREFGVTFTKDPESRAVMGISSGGNAAFTMAWFHPERYRRVLLYSPTFVNQQSPFNPAIPHGAWEYHDHIIAETPKKPLRIWMEVGEHDNRYQDPDSTFHNWVTASKRTAAVLKDKGYDYRFVLAKDAVHVDQRVVQQTLPFAVEYVWQGYKPGGR